MRLRFVFAGVLAMGPLASTAQALEDPSAPAAYCAEVVNDDQTRNIPPSLIACVRQVLPFTEAANDDFVSQMTVWRCMSGRVFVCTYGANLPRWKANISRTSKRENAFCAENPNSNFIPAYATGRDTIYAWRCRGWRAVVEGQPFSIDNRGFINDFWKGL
jgi:hypothetical protein